MAGHGRAAGAVVCAQHVFLQSAVALVGALGGDRLTGFCFRCCLHSDVGPGLCGPVLRLWASGELGLPRVLSCTAEAEPPPLSRGGGASLRR